MIVIRRPLIQELREVFEIEALSFGEEAYPPSLFIDYLYSSLFYVAILLWKPVGYIITTIEEKFGQPIGHIVSIAVHPMYRGLGIGTKLMRYVEGELCRRGICFVYLEVSTDNRVALRLYTKLGYRIVGRIRRYYGARDAYVMVKELR